MFFETKSMKIDLGMVFGTRGDNSRNGSSYHQVCILICMYVRNDDNDMMMAMGFKKKRDG